MINARDLLQRMADRGLKLGCVESLTAGMFASAMCDVPGASAVFYGGIVSYDPSVKVALANVKQATIDKHGVVSAQVALEMAEGGRKALGVDVCVSCTGNAGPDAQKGSAAVGEVYLGLAYRGNVWNIPLKLEGSRNEIRQKTVKAMIAFVASLFPENAKK
jgi:PncC family amidohydrolase